MINLTPIAKNIQKRLFEKMKLLGREGNAPGETVNINGLTHDKLALRSTFLRMTSDTIEPIILMGGKLKTTGFFGTVPGGYDEIYGSRTYGVQQNTKDSFEARSIIRTIEAGDDDEAFNLLQDRKRTVNVNKKLSNKSKRPMPGLKSADITFKGGVRALREATVSWTCWEWEELNYLMPHFLAHGKTVMLEWGWVYDDKQLGKLPSFMKIDALGNKGIDVSAYTSYKNEVIDSDGDFDMMVGVIKNFEFTTRDDGGFDCQTILTSVGASILDNPNPNQTALDPTVIYNTSLNDTTSDLIEKLQNAAGEIGKTTTSYTGKKTENPIMDGDKNSLVNINYSLTLKSFIKNIDKYILSKFGEIKVRSTATSEFVAKKDVKKSKFFTKNIGVGTTQRENFRYYYVPGKTVQQITTKATPKGRGETLEVLTENTWVTWGWFEDNVLSKFLSLTSGDKDRPILTEFRSVEDIMQEDGKDSGITESVRIKNHKLLETLNINDYILPGQFYTQERMSISDNPKEDLPGDDLNLIALSKIVNNKDNFPSFTAKPTDTLIRTKRVSNTKVVKRKIGSETYKEKTKDYNWSATEWYKKDEYTTKRRDVFGEFEETTFEDIQDTIQVPGKYGYLRNMLINTKLIKEAFGVSNENEFTVETTNIIEAIETMFSLLNREISFWDFTISTDSIDTHRAKIIDEQTTFHNFNQKAKNSKSRYVDDVFTLDEQGNKGPEGVFYFPVWQKDSLVKRQNITAKVPDAMQLSVMYGSNMDYLKDFANPGSQFADKTGVAAGSLYHNQNDNNKAGIDLAIRNDRSKNIGREDANPHKPMTIDGGENILSFISKNTNDLESVYENELSKLNQSITDRNTIDLTKLGEDYDPSIPPPLPNFLNSIELSALIFDINLLEAVAADPRNTTAVQLYSNKFFSDGVMKQEFKNSVSFLTTQHGKYKQQKTPILIPLEIELDIDGIGGVYPGNSCNSTYLPTRYQDETVFQIFDVNHRVGNDGWTVTLTGKMRSTLERLLIRNLEYDELLKQQFENILTGFEASTSAIGAAAESAGKRYGPQGG